MTRAPSVPSLALLALAMALAAAGCVGLTPDDENDDLDAASGTGEAALVAAATSAAEGLDTPEEAWAAGYRPVTECVPNMGVHWLHKPGADDSAFDGALDAAQPEVVLFLPDTSDLNDTAGDRFLGVEYVVVTEDTPLNETGADIMGVPMDGPMAGHFPGMPWHSEVHIYLPRDGEPLVAAFNPDVHCPEGTEEGTDAV